ncbi:hypothetical protein ABW19_dt0204171 [Dactylella cylindrospora]|nr:hypothetical protein ABW19_dt0204171 [Dactylella cylindrospora]
MSRTTSTSTARAPPTQSSQYFPATPTLKTLDILQQHPSTRNPKPDVTNNAAISPTAIRRSPSSSSSSSRSSDDDSSVDHDGLLRKRGAFRKFGTSSRIVRGPKEETDDEDSPAFLPWTENAGDGANSAAAEEGPAGAQGPPTSRNRKRSNVSGYELNRRDNTSGGTIKRGLQQISIQPYTAVSDSGASTPASQSSPRRRIPGETRRGNESSPSMGSSFSDLSGESLSNSV